MFKKFIDLIGCVPPWINIHQEDIKHKMCPLIHKLESKEKVMKKMFLASTATLYLTMSVCLLA